MTETEPKRNLPEGVTYKVEKNHFDILDDLPVTLRRMLANCPYPWSVTEVAVAYQRFRGGGMSEGEAVVLISSRFNEMIAQRMRAEIIELYGPDHPQAGKKDHG